LNRLRKQLEKYNAKSPDANSEKVHSYREFKGIKEFTDQIERDTQSIQSNAEKEEEEEEKQEEEEQIIDSNVEF